MVQNVVLMSLLLFVACRPAEKKEESLALQGPEPKQTITADGLDIPVYDFEGLQPLLQKSDQTTYVINFWATWCAPCVKELPHFERLSSEYPAEDLQVILVNLDMPRMWESHLVPFLEEKQLHSQVVVLDDPKQNSWIPKVNQDWSGAIPATLIYKGGQQAFYEEPFTYEKLTEAITNLKKTAL